GLVGVVRLHLREVAAVDDHRIGDVPVRYRQPLILHLADRLRVRDPAAELLGQTVGYGGDIDQGLIVEPRAHAIEVEDVVSATARDVGGDSGGQIRGGDVINLDRHL